MPQTFLSAESILAAVDLDEQIVDVPEWPDADGRPGRIRLQQMTAEESIEWTKTMQDEAVAGHEGENGMFLMLVFCAKDKEGNRLFALEQVQALSQKSFHVLDRLQAIGITLNRMSAESRDAAKKILAEAAAGGSPTV